MRKWLNSLLEKLLSKFSYENKNYEIYVSHSSYEELNTGTSIETYEYDEDCILPIKIQANTLPEGWIWTDYDDGSGDIQSPGGESYFSYDLCTHEYMLPNNDHWSRWVDPEYRMSLKNFKDFAEMYIREKMLNI